MRRYVFEGKEAFIEAIEERLAEAGFERSDKLADVDLVLTYCTNITILEDLYYGEGGLISEVPDGAIVIDLSTSTPNLSTEIGDMLTVHNASFAACPVGFKNPCAKDVFKRKNMHCHLGGDDRAMEVAAQIADAICADVRPCDDISSTELSRAFETIQQGAEIVSALEAYELSVAYMDAPANVTKRGIEVEPASSVASSVLNAIRDERFENRYTVEMLMGEISAALMAADDYGLILPQLESEFHLYELLAIIGGSDLSASALSVVYDGSDDEDAAKLGLDWERAESLYSHGSGTFYEGDLSELDDSAFFGEGDGLDTFDDDGPFEEQDGFDFSMN